MFGTVFAFESRKFVSKKNLKIFPAFFLLLVALSIDGIWDYKATCESIENFQKTERSKVSQFMNYTLYGTRGVRLLFIPAPFCVISNDLAVYRGLVGTVDTGEGLYIYSDINGKELFSESSGFMDFSGVIFLIGCLLAILYGYDAARNEDYSNLLKNISGKKSIILSIVLVRLLLFNLALIILCFLSLLWFLINGINVFSIFFLYFLLVLVLAITFFVVGGAVIGSIKKKALKVGSLFVLPFVLLLLLPWIIQKIFYVEAANSINTTQKFEYEKLKVMMAYERGLYERFGIWKSGEVAPDEIKKAIENGQKNEYIKLKEFEGNRAGMISNRVDMYQLVAALFPTSFYKAANKELSSKGFKNFLKFYRYVFKMKYRFIQFYIDRKFYKPFPNTGLEHFINGDENLFFAESQLPGYFWWGIFLNFFYIAALLTVLGKIHSKKESRENIKIPKVDFKKGNILFALCKDEQVKRDILRYFQYKEGVACIDKIIMDFRFNGVRPDLVLKFLCRLAKTSEEKTAEYLSILGIGDLSKIKLKYEEILKFYSAVKLAKNSVEYVILDDFFKQESREFERDFFKLLNNLKAAGYKILYLSCEMYYPKNSLDEEITLDTFCLFPLPIDRVTLR